MRNTLTFDIRDMEDYIKTELPAYIISIDGFEDLKLHYTDNISREEPIFPCFYFEIYSLGADEKSIDSGNIENATNILLDLDIFTSDETSSPFSCRDVANDISYLTARFINEKLGLKIKQNDRVPSEAESIFRKKIRAVGVYDNTEKTIFTK